MHKLHSLVKKLPVSRLKKTKEKATVAGKKYYRKTTAFVKRRPLSSFFVILGALLLILIISQIFQTRKTETTTVAAAKQVQVYAIGDAPKATFQAKVEKAGVVKIFAQTSGVIQSVLVKEGNEVWQGQQIMSLSSNYQGSNAPAVQSQIAQTQYQNILDTFDAQKDLIQKQRDLAHTVAENDDKMRDIGKKSLDETNSLINANQVLLDKMNQDLQSLLASNPNDPGIPTLEASINQLQGGINQLRQTNRTVDFTSSNDNTPAKLSDMQRDTTLKQLDLQEKGLELSREVSRLQVSLAYINESLMYPASPFGGVIERVYVHEGDLVSPGTLLATVTANSVSATAVLMVPERIAKVIMQGIPSEFVIKDKSVAVTPYYISSQATDGQLYSVFYDLPEEVQREVTAGEYVTVNVPVSPVKVAPKDPFIPVDAIYQSQEEAFVLLARSGKAQTKVVKIGKVYGSYVEVISGIGPGDKIILDRNVIAGDKVTIQ